MYTSRVAVFVTLTYTIIHIVLATSGPLEEASGWFSKFVAQPKITS